MSLPNVEQAKSSGQETSPIKESLYSQSHDHFIFKVVATVYLVLSIYGSFKMEHCSVIKSTDSGARLALPFTSSVTLT